MSERPAPMTSSCQLKQRESERILDFLPTDARVVSVTSGDEEVANCPLEREETNYP